MNHLNGFHIMIVSKYFSSFQDFISLELAFKHLTSYFYREFYRIIVHEEVDYKTAMNMLDIIAFNSHLSDLVTKIDEKCFLNEREMKSIDIPTTVTCIDNESIFLCSSLTFFIFPLSLRRICDKSFAECRSLVEVVFPSRLTSIGSLCFYGCYSLTSVNRLSEISNLAFSGCQELLDLNIPKSVESLKMLEYGLKNIGENCFNGCILLNTIEIPDSVTEIGWQAFAKCTQLQKRKFQNYYYFSMTEFEFLYGTKSIKSIQSSCFIGCESLKCIDIPEGVIDISDNSFLRCTSLSEITFPYTVELFGVQSFYCCLILESIELPKKHKETS
ncbi:hypothetical protein EIN_007660, partial [Entamoeba invadens IP1]